VSSTSEQFDQEMSRLVGNLRPGAPNSRYVEYVEEVRRRYGHKPYDVIRKAVTLILDQAPAELPYASDEHWGMWIREAERQLLEQARATAGLLPLDEERQKREANVTYAEIYKRVGIGTEPFEWNLCKGIAKQRFRTATPTDEQIEEVYQKRRAMDIPVGRWAVPKHFPTWNKTQEDKDDFWTPELPPTP
jgi:hypothetical protein